jgi:hypothetical protein
MVVTSHCKPIRHFCPPCAKRLQELALEIVDMTGDTHVYLRTIVSRTEEGRQLIADLESKGQ